MAGTARASAYFGPGKFGVVGCLIIPFLFWIRSSLAETEEFLARRVRPSVAEIMQSIAANWRVVALGMGVIRPSDCSHITPTAS